EKVKLMSFDGIFINGICQELTGKLVQGKVEKVHQPESHTLIFLIRNQGENYQLLISSDPNNSRIHLTSEKKTNPLHPPLFCMVLRKHLNGGKINSISQPGLERVVRIHFSTYTELGDLEGRTLVCEFMGKHSNIILLDNDGKIIDSIKRVSHSISRFREVLPGRAYIDPPSQGKSNLVEIDEDRLASMIMSADSIKLTKLLVQNIQGISPLIATEMVFRSGIPLSVKSDLCGLTEIRKLSQNLAGLQQIITSGNFSPCIYTEKRKLVAFSSIALTHLNLGILEYFETLNITADTFYLAKDNLDRFVQLKNSLLQKADQEIDKVTAKLNLQYNELTSALECEADKVKGQLITNNIYQIPLGAAKVSVINYFDPDMPTIEIELDPNHTAADNAQAYFKSYNKSKKTIANLTQQICIGEENQSYLESIKAFITQCQTIADLAEIKLELTEQGYLTPSKPDAQKKREQIAPLSPLEFTSSDGFKVLVGRNNKQNDWLTLKNSQKEDIWLHTKNIPGAHVIIKTEGLSVPHQTIYEAALLAAYFSKAAHSSQVPVDYTKVKFVKKPSGAKPGMVIYTNEQTVFTKANDPWFMALGLDD
ncbi:MAG: NFACT RNA binding domain-containing protein, partial [Bacillota bacterium]|nr:NFACT RNA binding domain-containing protein [Bacillota bacterium]